MYFKESPPTIQSLFNNIAKRYDIGNSILSLSLHKRWNRLLIKKILSTSSSDHVLVDLCSGTGDIALNYLHSSTFPCHAYLIDFSSEMLECAQRKAKQYALNSSHKLSFMESDVQQLPLQNQVADCATLAYGIRNVKNPAVCIKEVFRILKPGGCFGILELTRPQNIFLRFGHSIYLRTFIPLLGRFLTQNRQAYHYLSESILSFISPSDIANLLKRNGFINVSIHSLNGGIATILLGYKPIK